MKLNQVVSIILLTTIVSCAPTSNATETYSFPTPTTITPTRFPTSNLQITYAQLKEYKNFTEFYAIDVTCISTNEICFSEPKLLFQSLKPLETNRTLPESYITGCDCAPDGIRIGLESAGDILIGDINTQEWLNITNTAEADHAPKWSTDGKSIYYIACQEDSTGMCTPQLIRYELKSKQKVRLLQAWTSSFTSNYAVSPDGKKVIFSASNRSSLYEVLYITNWDGTDSRQITTLDANETIYSFSLDGLKIVFQRSTSLISPDSKEVSDIFVNDLNSGEEKNLTENFDKLVSSPSFSPDEKWVIFHAFEGNGDINVYLVSVDTGKTFQITEDGDSGFPAWRQIAN